MRNCRANKAVLQIDKKEEERAEGNDGETSIPPCCLEEFRLLVGQKRSGLIEILYVYKKYNKALVNTCLHLQVSLFFSDYRISTKKGVAFGNKNWFSTSTFSQSCRLSESMPKS